MTAEFGEVFRVIDLVGVFANAMLGGLVARKMGFDPIGFVVLGILSGLGGGLLRDTLLQHGTPVALVDYAYVVTAVAGAVVVFVIRVREPVMRPTTYDLRIGASGGDLRGAEISDPRA